MNYCLGVRWKDAGVEVRRGRRGAGVDTYIKEQGNMDFECVGT